MKVEADHAWTPRRRGSIARGLSETAQRPPVRPSEPPSFSRLVQVQRRSWLLSAFIPGRVLPQVFPSGYQAHRSTLTFHADGRVTTPCRTGGALGCVCSSTHSVARARASCTDRTFIKADEHQMGTVEGGSDS